MRFITPQYRCINVGTGSVPHGSTETPHNSIENHFDDRVDSSVNFGTSH